MALLPGICFAFSAVGSDTCPNGLGGVLRGSNGVCTDAVGFLSARAAPGSV